MTIENFEDHCWKDIVTPEILETYMPYHRETYIGQRPALLAIDLYNLVYEGGSKYPHELVKDYKSSCGIYAYEIPDGEVKFILKTPEGFTRICDFSWSRDGNAFILVLEDPAGQRDPGQHLVPEADRFRQAFYGERRERVDPPVPRIAHPPGRLEDLFRGGELGHDAEQRWGDLCRAHPCVSARVSWMSRRISAIEIMGR